MTNPAYDHRDYYLRHTQPDHVGGGSGAAPGDGAPDAGDFIDSIGYTGTVSAGTYTRADVLAMFDASDLLDFSATVESGTALFEQGGGTVQMDVGYVLTKRYINGLFVDDFTLTVDPGSQVLIETRGI